MINNTYNYDKIKKQVKEELKAAITEGGREAVSESIIDIMKSKLIINKINFDERELKEYVEDKIVNALSGININDKIKNIKGINISELVQLNDFDLNKKINEINEKLSNSLSKIDAKQLLGGILVAKSRGIDYSEIFNEKEFNNFIKEYKFDVDLIKSITDEISKYKPQNIKFLDIFIDSVKELTSIEKNISSFTDLYKMLQDYLSKQPKGTRANNFWNELANSFDSLDNKTKTLLKDLGLLNKEKNGLNKIDSGATNKGGLIGTDNVVLTRKITDKTTPENTLNLKKALDEVSKAGVNCARILDVVHDKESDLFLEIQETAKGFSISNIADGIEKINTNVFKATDEQIEKLISDLKILYNAGIEVDVENLSNILYDAKKGFSFIDLDLLDPNKEINGVKTSFSSFEEMLSSFIQTLRWQVDDINEILQAPEDASSWEKFADKVESASKDMVKGALEAIRTTQNSHSDAKETISLGEDFGGGFARGIDNSVERAKKSAENLVKETKKELKSKINLNDLFAEIENTAPKIKGSKTNGNQDINKFVSKNSDVFKKSIDEIIDEEHVVENKVTQLLEPEYKRLVAANRLDIPRLKDKNGLSSGTTIPSPSESDIKKWKEYNDLVAVGYDRQKKMEIISQSGTSGNNSVYDLLRLNHPIWDEVKANNFFNTIPEDGLKRYNAILEVVERIVKEMVEASGLTEEQIVSQLKNIKSAQGGYFKANGNDSGWSHFATYSDSQNKDVMNKPNGITYKVYAAFDDIKDLNENIISSLMEELSKAGFKGRLKTTTGSTSFGDKLNGLAITDQLVVHGSSKKDQEIAYNTIKNFLGNKLSYLGGGIDTPDGSFSETLRNGTLGKYLSQIQQESQAAQQAAKSEYELAEARKEASQAAQEQPNKSDNLFEESSRQTAFFDRLKESQEEIREEIQKTDEQIKDQMSLSNNIQNQNDNNLVDINIEDYDTLYSKLSKIKELSENISLFNLEDIDDSIIKELDETLFSLSEKDLKHLGFENTSAIIEDLQEIQERLHNVNWEFENNTYDDESYIDSGTFKDDYNYIEDLKFGISETKQNADAAAISINNLMNLLSEMDISKFYSDKDSAHEKIVQEQNDQLEKQIELRKTNQKEIVEAIEKEQVLLNSEQNITNSKKKNVLIYIPDKNQAKEHTEDVIDSIKDVEAESKKSTDSQISDYKRIKSEIQETQKEIDKLYSLEKNKSPKYVEDVYNDKLKKYSGLNNEDFDLKILEKKNEGIRSDKHGFNVDITSIKALIDEAQKRSKKISFTDFVQEDIKNIDELLLAFERVSKYLSSLNDENYKDDIPEKLRQATSKKYDLLEQLKKVEKSSVEDQIDYEFNYLINSIKESGKRGSFGSANANELINIFTKKGITDKNVISEQVKLLTDNKSIINAVNKELEYKEKREKAAAIASEEAAKAAEKETLKLEQQNQQMKENVDTQESLTETTSNKSQNVLVSNKYTSINKGFDNEQNVVSVASSSEISSLEALKNKIVEVREAVESKTASFEIEKHTVDFVTEEEIIALDKLIVTLKTIKTIINEISTDFSNLSLNDLKINVETKGITALTNLLKNDKLDINLTSIYTYLDDFAKSVNQIDFKNNLVEDLNQLLSKSEELKNLSQILKSTKTSIKSVSSKNTQSDSDELKKLENAYKTLISSEESYQRLKALDKLSIKDSGRLEGLEIERENAKNIISSIGDEIKKNTKFEKEYAEEVEKTTRILQAEKIASENNNRSKLINDLQSQINSLSKLEIAPKYTNDFSNKISDEINSAKIAMSGTDEEIKSATEHLKDFAKAIPKNALESSYTALNKFGLDVSDILSKNTRISSELKNELLEMSKVIKNFKITGNFDDKDLLKIKNRIIDIRREINDDNKGGLSWIDETKQQLKGMWERDIARYFGFNDIIRYIRIISSTVTELDTALTELRKVSDASNERLQQSFQKSAETAKELGSSITNIINATADWSRLGYSVDDAEELAKVSQLYVNVGDNMTMEEANESLISTLQGFELQAENAESIVDKFNEVANNYAIDTKGIGAALQRSAASFNAANTDLNQSIALVTTANTIAQDPDKVGNAFTTLSARIRGSKSELEDLGEETDAYVESTSKLRDQVKATTGVDIMKDEKTYKDVYTILVEIGKVWKDLEDIDQAALLEALAGKRQSNILAGVLNNAELLEKVYKTASQDAEGSAQKEQENYEKSIQYSIDRLKATAQDLAQDFIKSDWIKTAVDGLNSILELVDKLVEHTGSLVPILTTIAGIITSIKLTQGVGDIASTFKNLSGNEDKTSILSRLKDFLGKRVFEKSGEELGKGLADATAKGFSQASKTLGSELVEGLTTAELDALSMFESYEAAEASVIATTTELGTATTSVAGAVEATGISMGAFIGIATGVVAIIGTLIISIKELSEVSDEVANKAKELGDEYTRSINKMSEYANQIDELQSTIHNEKASIEEVSDARVKLFDLKKQMMEQYKDEPSLINKITAAINGESDAVENLQKAYDNKKYKEMMTSLNDTSGWNGFWNQMSNDINGYKTNKERIINEIERPNKSFFVGGMTTNIQKLLTQNGYSTVGQGHETGALKLDGSLDNVYNKLLDILDLLEDEGYEGTQFFKNITNEANKTKDTLEKYSEYWDAYILNERILNGNNDKLANDYKALNDAYANYSYALSSGASDEEIKEISDKYSNILKEAITDSGTDESVKEYFMNMYPELQDIFDSWNFEVNISPKISEIEKANLKSAFAQLASDGYADAKSINNLNNDIENVGTGTIGAIGLQNVLDVANDMGLGDDITQLVTFAVKEGWINGTPDETEFKAWAERKGFTEAQLSSLSDTEYQKALTIPKEAVSSWDSFIRLIKETDDSLKGFSKSEMNDAIDELSDGFDKLDEIYADIFDKGSFDFSKLNTKKFKESFEGLEDEYTDFIETVSSNPDDINKVQSAFDNLVSAYIDQSNILNHLTKDNKDLAIARLETMGVSNAEAIVNDKLNASLDAQRLKSRAVAAATQDMANNTSVASSKLLEESNMSNLARVELANLVAEQTVFNNQSLNVDDKIAALGALAQAYFGVAAAQSLSEMTNNRGYEHSYSVDPKEAWNRIVKQYTKLEVPKIDYKGGDKTKDAIDKANKSAEESKEIIDWIEVAIKRVQEQITRLGKIVSATYRGWSERNKSLVSEMEEVRKEIGLQSSAYQAYLRDAEAIPLAENYKKLVREGAMFAETITDKTLKKNIDQYKELYEKAIAASDAIEDLRANIAQLAKQKFDNVIAQFDEKITDIEHRVKAITSELSNVETRNKIAGKSFYSAQIAEEEKRQEELKKEREDLIRSMNEAVESGSIEYMSQDWIEMRDKIYSVDEALWDSANAVEELKQKMKEVIKLDFDDLKKQFDNIISLMQGRTDTANSLVSLLEASGHIAGKQYYEAITKANQSMADVAVRERDRLQAKLNEGLASGDISEYDDNWVAMKNDIEACNKQIIDYSQNIVDAKNAMRQLDWELFERTQTAISNLNEEAQFLIDLMSDEELFDDKGSITKYGRASQGLLVEQYLADTEMAENYKRELSKVNEDLAKDPNNKELIDKQAELRKSWQDSIKSAQDMKKALVDLARQGYEKLRDSIQKLIDDYKKALDQEKALHDYERTISNQTQNINNLKKQISAYENDMSEEGRAKVQKLSAELEKAQDELNETEYDKYISDQKEMLDNFSEDLNDWIDNRLKDTDGILERSINEANANAGTIRDTINSESNKVGYITSSGLNNVWTSVETGNGIIETTSNTCSEIANNVFNLPTNITNGLKPYLGDESNNVFTALSDIDNNLFNGNQSIYKIAESIVNAANGVKSSVEEWGGKLQTSIQGISTTVTVNVDKSGNVETTSSGGNGGGTGGGSGTGGITSGTPSSGTGSKQTYAVVTPAGAIYTSHLSKENADKLAANLNSKLPSYGEVFRKYKNSGLSDQEASKKAKEESEKKYKVIVSQYKKGGLIGKSGSVLDIIAKALGEDHMVAAKEGERILTADQNKNFEKLVNNLTPYNLLDAYNVGNNSFKKINGVTSTVSNVGDISINLPNVTRKEEFVTWLKTDGQIEKIIQSMSLSKMMGKNSYDKMKY